MAVWPDFKADYDQVSQRLTNVDPRFDASDRGIDLRSDALDKKIDPLTRNLSSRSVR